MSAPEDNPADDILPTQEDMAAYDEWHAKEKAKESAADNRLAAALALLRDYERWEGDLILENKAWDTPDGLPKLTRELNDRLIELQLRRNVILAAPSQPPEQP